MAWISSGFSLGSRTVLAVRPCFKALAREMALPSGVLGPVAVARPAAAGITGAGAPAAIVTAARTEAVVAAAAGMETGARGRRSLCFCLRCERRDMMQGSGGKRIEREAVALSARCRLITYHRGSFGRSSLRVPNFVAIFGRARLLPSLIRGSDTSLPSRNLHSVKASGTAGDCEWLFPCFGFASLSRKRGWPRQLACPGRAARRGGTSHCHRRCQRRPLVAPPRGQPEVVRATHRSCRRREGRAIRFSPARGLRPASSGERKGYAEITLQIDDGRYVSFCDIMGNDPQGATFALVGGK